MKLKKLAQSCDKGTLYMLKGIRALRLKKPALALLDKVPTKTTDISVSDAHRILSTAYPKNTEARVFIERDESWNKSDEHYNLSVLIPTYNCADYLVKCLRSLVSQKTDYTWQAIVVNDGSTDDTAERLRRFRKYPNIKIITQENKGFSGARNTALTYCASDYLMFLDSDDLLAKGAIQNLLSYAYANDLDVVEGNYLNLRDGKTFRDSEFHTKGIVNNPVGTLAGYPWMKVYKTDLFRSIQYPENFLYEDSIISFLIYPLCGLCGTIEDVVYYYRRHSASFSYASKGKAKSIDTYYIAELMYDCMTKLNIDPLPLYDLFLGHVFLSGTRMAYSERELREAVFTCFCDLHDKIYAGSTSCSPGHEKTRKYLLNRDFKKFDFYTRMG